MPLPTVQLVNKYRRTNDMFQKVWNIVKQVANTTPKVDHVAVRLLTPMPIEETFSDRKLILQPQVYNFPSFKASARWYSFGEQDSVLLKRLFVTTYKGDWFPNIDSYSSYQNVSQINPFLAWTTLFNRHLNHIAIEVQDIEAATEACLKHNIPMNHSNGLYKISKDGLLIQTATMAVPIKHTFLDGTTHEIPYTFVELVERKKNKEGEKREGFEQENALHIFKSTTDTR